MYKLFLTLRYLFARRIAYFAIAAVMLCTAMIVIVNSVMGGFLDKIKAKARGLLGDIVVNNNSARGFPLYGEFITDISKWPEIEAAAPVIFSYGLLSFQDTAILNTVQVNGIDLEKTYRINAFKQSLFYEKYYPGSTTLGVQQQPKLGFDPERSPVSSDSPGEMWVTLPADLLDLLAKSRAAGIEDRETVDSGVNVALRKAGLPTLPGLFEVNIEGATDDPSSDDGSVGRAGYFGDPREGIIIGRDLVAFREKDGRYRRYMQRGRMTILTLLPISDGGSVDAPIKVPLRYADDSRTGIYEIDSKTIYCDFALLQRLLLMDEGERADDSGKIPARCSQIQIKIKPGVDANKLAERLEQHYRSYLEKDLPEVREFERNLLSGIRVQTWEESQAAYIAPVEKERILVTILFAIISLVAAVLVMCILYMIVLQKTRDIGIVKSLGGSSAGVAAIFVGYGAAIGVVGAAIGGTLGYLFVIYINEIQAWLIHINPAWQVWDRSVYSFDEIPNTVRTSDFAIIVVCGILLAIFGSLAAAWRAARMQPVEALRYE